MSDGAKQFIKEVEEEYMRGYLPYWAAVAKVMNRHGLQVSFLECVAPHLNGLGRN